jgi:hypothetical protein
MAKLPPQQHHHKHEDGCYRLVLKCGKREHTAHTANCKWNEKRKRFSCGGLHTHTKKCYKRKLDCKIYGTVK